MQKRRFSFVPPAERRGMIPRPGREIESGGDSDETSRLRSPQSSDSSDSDSDVPTWDNKRIVQKWYQLRHNGPRLPPPYAKLPQNVRFLYNKQPIRLSRAAEEVASLYAKLLKTDFCKKLTFRRNFFQDFRNAMTDSERALITNFALCDFEKIHNYYQHLTKNKKVPTSVIDCMNTLDKDREKAKFAFCLVDGVLEKIANYHVEPPAIFRGRGDHPQLGRVKQRILMGDIKINCSPNREGITGEGRGWRDVVNDPYVSWMASWTDPISNIPKYIKLSPASHVRYTNDIEKFEVARRLSMCIDNIRDKYQSDLRSPHMVVRQQASALYLIDKLALRPGYESNSSKADTVGCSTLRVEHLTLDPNHYKISLQFLGKDSISYQNKIQVERALYNNLKLFIENKRDKDLLFDEITASDITNYLKGLMVGLTPKVFRTHNASVTFENQLALLTENCSTMKEKISAYTEANRKVATLCNHQRTPPKTLEKSLAKISEKIQILNQELRTHNRRCSLLKRRPTNVSRTKLLKKCKTAKRILSRVALLECQKREIVKNSTIALGTSKLNYIDPRITIAWCKQYNVPINKIFKGTTMEKFAWAIQRTRPTFRFQVYT